MKRNTKLFKRLDYLIMFIALLLVILSLAISLLYNDTGAHLIITTPQDEWIYDLDTNRTFGAEGTLGISVITINEGDAFFESSPCDNQICVLSHPITNNLDFIACLPNQIFIRIESSETTSTQDSSLDSIGY